MKCQLGWLEKTFLLRFCMSFVYIIFILIFPLVSFVYMKNLMRFIICSELWSNVQFISVEIKLKLFRNFKIFLFHVADLQPKIISGRIHLILKHGSSKLLRCHSFGISGQLNRSSVDIRIQIPYQLLVERILNSGDRFKDMSDKPSRILYFFVQLWRVDCLQYELKLFELLLEICKFVAEKYEVFLERYITQSPVVYVH